MDSLLHYKQDGYLDINGFLRTSPLPLPEKLDEKNMKEYVEKLKIKNKDYKKKIIERVNHIKNIDSYMNYNTYGNKTFYRGYSHMGDTFEKLLKEGGSLISKNYCSTSYNTSIAENFINDNTEGNAILCFKIPIDIKSFDFAPLEKKHKNLEQEEEVLLERNTEFEILDKQDGIYIAKLKKYDPFLSKELREVEKMKKEISKLKIKEAEEETYKKDIKKFIEEDYDGGDIDDAFLDFSLLYTIEPKKEEMVEKLFKKMLQKGGRKRKKQVGGSKFFNIFKILKRQKLKLKKKLRKLRKK